MPQIIPSGFNITLSRLSPGQEKPGDVCHGEARQSILPRNFQGTWHLKGAQHNREYRFVWQPVRPASLIIQKNSCQENPGF
mgnify:CR=1 FL=1|jgi:hypothetical protein